MLLCSGGSKPAPKGRNPPHTPPSPFTEVKGNGAFPGAGARAGACVLPQGREQACLPQALLVRGRHELAKSTRGGK